MKRPNWTTYFLRVGGVLVLYAILIVVTRELAPGSEGFVVLGISILGVIALTARELWAERSKAANRLKK
jgi:hypothetical protein